MMTLYGFAGSPNTWKVRALAHHIGVPLEFTQIDFKSGEHKQPRFLGINPTARTPALVDGDVALWESTALLHYIAEKKPGAVLGQTALERADILRWHSWHLAHWHDACQPYLFENVVKQFMSMGPPDETRLAAAATPFAAEAKVLDAHLAKRSHLVGDRLTLADFSVASMLIHAEAARYPLAPYANVARWSAGVLALPGWAASAPKQ